ncbi:hypothetical protein CPC08DRAFT_769875 [Agrocybe pediades]|nr:hypothetical protein CPC08DRAFT_769875 [Agrocybe pediades]
MAGFILADGALLWRCFHACGGTLTASFLLPMGMFIVEIALAFASLAFDILTEHPKPGTALIYHKVYNQISGAAFTVIAATSSIATFLICTTIYTYTTHSRSARKRLRHVVDTLTQSCGIYTAVAIMHAILNIKLDTGYLNNSTTITVFGLNKYSMSLIYVTSGLVPTLMVARLATSSNPTDVVDTESEPASLVSLPPQLGGQPDPERASIDAVHIQLDKASSSDGDVDHDGSILVDESRGRRIVGGYEELIIGALDGQAAAVMINGGSVE